jgi:hypothetical protein
MTTRILGPRGGRRRRRFLFLLLPALAAAALGLLYVTGAQAVHDVGVFQLDRNAQTSVPSGAAGEDWDMVCPPSTPPGAASCIGGTNAVASTFDTDAANATIFTGGGSKDDLDTTNWNWKDGSVPDKDDLAHAYAARYTSGGTVYLYFGADRLANNGDSQIGFWFFLGNVAPVAGGTFGPAAHTNGDILILSDFTQGGAVITVRVFEWHSPGGAINGTLDLIAGTTATPADCIGPPPVGAGDRFCATVNTATTPSPWAFTDKTGTNPGSFNSGEFYEGGLNLSALGLGNECFSSFLSETRSSQSVDATLKDFVGGRFAVCAATMSTTPSVGAGTKVLPGTPVADTATVTGSGTASPPTPTGNVTFFICGPITTGTCTSDGTQVGPAKPLSGSGATATATSDAFDTTGKAPGRYCWRAEWPGDANYPRALAESGTGESECFFVIDTTSVTTAQDWLPNDSASVTSAGGSGLNGTLVFTLYDSGDCTGTVLYTEPTITLSGAASPATRSTTNTAVRVSASKTVSWKVVFTSTDPNVRGSTSRCETTSLTITN